MSGEECLLTTYFVQDTMTKPGSFSLQFDCKYMFVEP